MNVNLVPFNIGLLTISDIELKAMRPVRVLDIFQASSKNFHLDGMFSIETFGKVGEEKRNRLFSYIDLRIDIFHPVIFKALSDLKGLYADIISSREYAIFDAKTKDFIKSDAIDGQTGYSFFLKHFKELKFEERPSAKREFNIKLVEKYKDKGMLNKLLVMPAGLRDYTIDENGKPSEDEINLLYRKVFSIASVIENINPRGGNGANLEYLDSARFNLQRAVNELYTYITNILEGKSRLVLGKWAARKIYNSTRNVITSFIPDTQELLGPKTVSTNQTVVGLYQYLRMTLPLAIKHVRDTYLSNVFIGPNSPAVLVNKKTLEKELVSLDPEHYDEWMTYEGLEKVMARFGQENLRHEPLEVSGYYIGLIYKTKDHFKFLSSIKDLAEGLKKEDVYPITFVELLHLSVYKDANTIPCFVTRYPVTGYGSIYPSYVYLKSTVKADTKEELGDDWQPNGNTCHEFPRPGENFYNSMSPSVSHIARLGADYDRYLSCLHS